MLLLKERTSSRSSGDRMSSNIALTSKGSLSITPFLRRCARRCTSPTSATDLGYPNLEEELASEAPVVETGGTPVASGDTPVASGEAVGGTSGASPLLPRKCAPAIAPELNIAPKAAPISVPAIILSGSSLPLLIIE